MDIKAADDEKGDNRPDKDQIIHVDSPFAFIVVLPTHAFVMKAVTCGQHKTVAEKVLIKNLHKGVKKTLKSGAGTSGSRTAAPAHNPHDRGTTASGRGVR